MKPYHPIRPTNRKNIQILLFEDVRWRLGLYISIHFSRLRLQRKTF